MVFLIFKKLTLTNGDPGPCELLVPVLYNGSLCNRVSSSAQL